MNKKHILVFDIGKTHIKLQVLDSQFTSLLEAKNKNQVKLGAPYPRADVDAIWMWLVTTLNSWSITQDITDIVVTTHGATAAIINSELDNENGLVLPVLDYEFDEINDFKQEYELLRPAFNETHSPALPAGLNLGRQLVWLNGSFPAEFAKATHILMYPQYWVWRLTGLCCTEVTSLGCHTDLWSPSQRSYSSLVSKLCWQTLLGEPVPAWSKIGHVQSNVTQQTGLSAKCKVYAGVHDSNASYLRYLSNQAESSTSNNEPFTVLSTGTWTILMSSNKAANLDEHKDMLANVDILGNPVACARFMGGREYESICAQLGGDIEQDSSAQALQFVLDHLYMVTPDFSEGNGPFGGMVPIIQAPQKSQYAQAIATLYCALMIDYQLSQLSAVGNIYIEGAFLQNRLLCQILAQLRGTQRVMLSGNGSGTVDGAALLTQWGDHQATMGHTLCAPSEFKHLTAYKQHWLELVK
ncbi:FGGY family carbohydrate kinase [Paraglaciecola sp.]|uniref:FGGY-family carbohydrate kinase n=1 Tax=Paraglaciecola sp. TaxID=1920173 RepID=UPI003264FEC0